MSGVWKQRARSDLAFLNVVFCFVIITGSVEAQCSSSKCLAPEKSIRETNAADPGTCFDATTVITITCTTGFTQSGTSYQATCDNTTGEWHNSGSCDIDNLSVIIAAIVMLAIVSVFSICIVRLCKGSKIKQRRFIYDTSIDTSEVIDGHPEDKGGVVNISMIEIQPPSPRVIAIDDPDDMDNETGNTTPSDTTVPVDVHTASELAALDMLDGYGVIGEKPLTPTDPQAGSSTEHLIDMTRAEPDGQASLEPHGTASLELHGTIGRPLTRRKLDSETTAGGSFKVRPVTAPPPLVLTGKSASVRNYGPKDSPVDVDALYAKINRVKRASSRWPPGPKDKKPAASTDGWNHIDDVWKETEKYPTEPATGERIKEDVYAELNYATGDGQKEDPSTSKKIPPKVATKQKSKKVRYNTPPSGDQSALYARVDRSRPSSKSSILDSNLDPPAPPPIDGAGGLYAQIDRDRNSKEDLTSVGVADDGVRVEEDEDQ